MTLLRSTQGLQAGLGSAQQGRGLFATKVTVLVVRMHHPWFLGIASARLNMVRLCLLALAHVQRGSLGLKSCQCLFLQRCCSRDHEEPRELQKRQLISRPCLRNGFNLFSTPTASFILS